MKILDEALIQLDVDVDTADEAIQYMADILYRLEYVEAGYAERVIAREKEFPTGLIGQGCGIAVPHTNPDCVIKPAVCVLIPKKPLRFMMMGTTDKPVMAEIILPLVVKDSKMQINVLRKIAELLKDTQKLDKIRKCNDKKEILRMLAFLEEE